MDTKHAMNSDEKHAELLSSMGKAAYTAQIHRLDNESCVNFKCVVQKALWQSPLFRRLLDRRVCFALGLAAEHVLTMEVKADEKEVHVSLCDSPGPLRQLLVSTSAVTHWLPSVHKSQDIMTDTQLQLTDRFATTQPSAFHLDSLP